jgi:hypothetical protein
MEAIQGTSQTPSNQGVQPSQPQPTPTPGNSAFETTLKGLLTPDSANKVSEEELFAALVQERLGKTKGEDALKEFQDIFTACKEKLKKPDGFIPVEDAAKQALVEFAAAKKISTEEADAIYSQSFAAAQLDDNKDVLFDNRGGGDDPTLAVASMEQALLLSRAVVDQIDSGAMIAPKRSVTEPTASKAAFMGGSSEGTTGADAGFLFKPISDSDGKLAVLLPSRLAGLVKGVTLIGPNGDIIETGRYTGNGNGGRDHYRFTKPGSQYPDGLTVQATLITGEIVKYIIKETSERTEGGNSGSGGDQSSSGSGSSTTGGTTNSSPGDTTSGGSSESSTAL